MDISPEKPTLAVALIVKNEEKHLRACLETVTGWVDEIVILDSGSTDATESIAREFTDKFYVNTDWPGFGKQRQLAQSYIQSDYVLWLDADERVTEELKSSIQRVVAENRDKTVYRLNRLSSAFGKFIRYSGWSPDWIVRLYKISDATYDDSLVHEKVILKSGLYTNDLDGKLIHYTYSDLFQCATKHTQYARAWSEQRYGNKKVGIKTAVIHSAAAFLKTYLIKLGFLDGRHGFVLSVMNAHYTFLKYAGLSLKDYSDSKCKCSKR